MLHNTKVMRLEGCTDMIISMGYVYSQTLNVHINTATYITDLLSDTKNVGNYTLHIYLHISI